MAYKRPGLQLLGLVLVNGNQVWVPATNTKCVKKKKIKPIYGNTNTLLMVINEFNQAELLINFANCSFLLGH